MGPHPHPVAPLLPDPAPPGWQPHSGFPHPSGHSLGAAATCHYRRRCHFKDMAMYFSHKEGQQVGSDQEALYRDMMPENYGHVGLPVPNPELISELEQGEELWVLGLMGAEKPEPMSSSSTGLVVKMEA